MWQKEQIINEFKKRGKRITQQRLIILDVILEGSWNCGKEIYYEATKRDSSIGMATVYRTLNALEEMGILSRRYQYLLSGKGEEDQIYVEREACN
ncbi:MAG: transcriptional repressor [Clostridiales bacterium]|nr:transcriptional repressor [Clostridiales bacterium]